MQWDDIEDIREARRIIKTLHADLRFEWKFNRVLMMVITILSLAYLLEVLK